MSLQKPLTDPAVKEILAAVQHLTAKEIADHPKCWISAQTIRNWRKKMANKEMMRPHHLSLMAVARVVEMEYMLVTAKEAKMVRDNRTDLGITRKVRKTSMKRSPIPARRQRRQPELRIVA